MNWKDEKTKEALIVVVANHMKKCYLSWNKDTVEDTVIYDHLMELSNGTINLHNREKGLTKSYELMKVNMKSSNKNTSTTPPNQNGFNKYKPNNKNKNGINSNNNSISKKPFINNNNPKV
jgi:hypothetical protein